MLVIFNSSKQHDAPLQNIQSSNGWTESLSQGGFLISDIIPTAHPITLAHRLIRLAICLGEINDDTSQRTKLGLEEPISTAARRYYETASRTVMSQDSLVGSLDGLETLMLQSRYHISVGELHTARLIFKRASHIAHTMKLPQQARLLGSRAESIWFQILYSDRFISLMLGQPFSVIDNPSIAQDRTCRNITPQILERIHVEISEQIIVRNLRIQHNRQHIDVRDGDSIQDHKETKRLDYDLKKAARALPSTWWISPIVEDAESDGRAMEKTAKLLLQMHHYYLLVLIHQPYLLEVVRWTSSQIELHSLDQAYSKMAIVSASREILSRYLLLRKIHRSPSYRGFDDKAFTAGVALLLTHLDGHRLGSANVLEHQRPQDLGILDSVIGCIEVLSCRNRDSQGSYRAKLLRRFIQIEANAAEGNNHTVCNDEALDENQKSHSTEEGCDLKFDIPYFGTIHIIRHTSARSNFNDIPSMNPISDTAPELFLSDTLSMESPE
jgi:hypothetical protein